MQHTTVNPTDRPTPAARPIWVRGLALAVIWTLVLQPLVSSAQLAQLPMFTVTSAPPNVMLMMDDSASMNRLDLNPTPAFAAPAASWTYPWATGNPLLKLNTVGYFGISGMAYYFGGQPTGGWTDGYWNFGWADVLTRSAAFNPLAYNPAIQYLPWNNNGARLPNASIGGTGNVATGALTEWDPRNLPPAMGGGTVYSKLTAPNQGVIDSNGETQSWAAPVAGSVAYAGLPGGNAGPVTAATPSGADLFTSTIAWDNPNCTSSVTPTLYNWYCPAGSGWQPPSDACTVVGTSSVDGTCCPAIVYLPPTVVTTPNLDHYQWFSNPPGFPPAMTGPGGQVCTSPITYTGSTRAGTPSCVPGAFIRDDPPYEVPCPPGGGEVCYFDPPALYGPPVCTPTTEYLWHCQYTLVTSTPNPTCPATVAQLCGSSPGTPTCTGYGALTTTSDARYTGGHWTPARYVIYDGPAARTPAQIQDVTNYRMIMVDRKFGWNGATQVPSGTSPANAVGKYYVVDGVTGLPAPASVRPDCPQADAFGPWCTWQQEARNYANWYTYYRSRLFAAIAVVSEVTSDLIGPEQFMRMGYGRINYFPNSRNNWNVQSVSDRNPATLPTIDGAANEGGVERGVRPFTVNSPPLSAIPNPDRQAVFNWLFSVNGLGPTPNREALHGAGLYFTRFDSRGPWGNIPGLGGGELPTEHLWCRRNYTLLATDGEWTRLPVGQPLLESGSLAGTRKPLGGGPESVSRSMSIDGPAITGTDRDNPLTILNYQYLAGSEPQISGGFGSSQTETLTDVLHYYWSHDLRPGPGVADLRNSIQATPRNRAFWQHMSSYIVGYGVSASVDDPARVPSLRTDFDARNLISWPEVGQEPCRQLDDNADDTALNPSCGHTVSPSGNRINDTLRGGLASGGDFFSATSPTALKASLQAVFAAIGADPAAGTSPGLSSSTIGAGNLLIQSGFFTNTWDGYIRAYDQALQVAYLEFGGIAPTPLWSINFAAPAARPIFTSTAINTPVPFEWASITGAQQAALGSSPILDYLRGDQTRELRFAGGTFRNRINTILGDIVSSTPLLSKGADHGYLRKPAASAVLPLATATQGSSLYPSYVTAKRTTRAPVAIFGANDGMLHVLDARVPPQPTAGREIFAFVPRSLYSTLGALSSPVYPHRFYVDGPVIESDVFTPPSHATPNVWKTIAIGTTGAGSAGVFAIDVTSPESGMSASNLLWDIVPSEHTNPVVVSDLGNILQPGIVGSVKDNTAPNGQGRWVYIVGNGYESVNNEATLFVFDVFTGSLIKAIQTNVGNAATPNGLGGITPVFDGSRNISAVYGGDKLGNMWKFDLNSPCVNVITGSCTKTWEIFNKVGATPAPLFRATDPLNNPQPITAAPRITPHGISGLHVGFGTGKLFEPVDRISTQVQSLYVLWDKAQLPTILKPSLQRIRQSEFTTDHDLNVLTPDQTFRRLNAADLAGYDWTQQGFYIDLIVGPAEGERILSPGFLDAGVLSFTSFAQQSAGTDLCTPGGSSVVYRFNLIGGLGDAGFLGAGLSGPVIGRRIQPGLVSAAPPIYEPVTPTGLTVDSMTAADATKMLKNPKYTQSGGRANQTGATGKCAHIGLRVDGAMARIPTACAGLMPIRTWRPVR